MPMSNFNAGFRNGVSIRGVPLAVTHPGKVVWVSNNTTLDTGELAGSNGNDGSFRAPYATISYAVTQCRANKGDIVFVKPGHVETVATAAGVAIGVAGVAVVGLGVGASRPKLNLTATASTITITAASVLMHNILITGGIDAVVSAVVISAADVKIVDCEYRDVTGECTLGFLTTAAADRLEIRGLKYAGAVGAGTNAGIRLVGGTGIVITDLDMVGNFAVGGIDVATTATTDLLVRDVPRFKTYNAADIFIVDTITGSTGQIGGGLNLQLKDNAANITEACTGATFVYMQPINIVNLAGESSIQDNKTASTDA